MSTVSLGLGLGFLRRVAEVWHRLGKISTVSLRPGGAGSGWSAGPGAVVVRFTNPAPPSQIRASAVRWDRCRTDRRCVSINGRCLVIHRCFSTKANGEHGEHGESERRDDRGVPWNLVFAVVPGLPPCRAEMIREDTVRRWSPIATLTRRRPVSLAFARRRDAGRTARFYADSRRCRRSMKIGCSQSRAVGGALRHRPRRPGRCVTRWQQEETQRTQRAANNANGPEAGKALPSNDRLIDAGDGGRDDGPRSFCVLCGPLRSLRSLFPVPAEAGSPTRFVRATGPRSDAL